MECNKEEAIRVTGMAERKFDKGDLVGAKRLILKALKLYPCLNDAIQLSAVLDVHIAAQVKVGINEPEPDYYIILQVEPLSDDGTIKKQYRNLSKLVHPDKSKESMKKKSGAAFQLIAKAFEVLSDKETRFQHDSKRGEQPTAEEPPRPMYSTHQPQQQNARRSCTPRANPQPQREPRTQEPPQATYSANQPRHQAAAQSPPAPGAQASQAPNTFWAPPTRPPGVQASHAPNTFWAPPTRLPGVQASQAPNTSWAQPPPAPGAQASQAPNTSWAQPPPAPGAQASQAPYTFSTACPFCQVQYQCMSIFLNYEVVCQNCNSSFPANDINVHPANGASAFVWPPETLGNNNPFLPSNGVSAFVWPPGLWGDNNPFLAGTNWYEMFQNHLAQPYGASTNGTSWNNLLAIFSGANPYGDYGASTNGTSWNNLFPTFSGGNPFGDFGNNPSPMQSCLSMLFSAMNLS